MFLVNDGFERRERRVRSFLYREPVVAVLLAAGNFEWTLYRAIVSLGNDPNVELREKMSRIYGLDRYKEFWREEIACQPGGRPLTEIVNWSALRVAFCLRNKLIHGRDRCTTKMSIPQVEIMLQAAADVHNYCLSRNVNLDGRLRVRRRKVTSQSGTSARNSL
jgi:hypothetical protein